MKKAARGMLTALCSMTQIQFKLCVFVKPALSEVEGPNRRG
jgi:hypothetical protein